MYAPSYFREERRAVLADAVRSIKLAVLVTGSAGDLQVTHVPLLLKERDGGEWTLHGHVARGNNHWKLAGTESPTVAIFQGPHAYVTPQWYATKQETGKVVPTWNYIAVHAHGRLIAHDDSAWLLNHVNALTDFHESMQETQWSVDDAPAEYIENLSRAIVGIELHVTRIEASWKMSQNKTEADRNGVIEGLDAHQDGTAVATVMRELESLRNSKS